MVKNNSSWDIVFFINLTVREKKNILKNLIGSFWFFLSKKLIESVEKNFRKKLIKFIKEFSRKSRLKHNVYVKKKKKNKL